MDIDTVAAAVEQVESGGNPRAVRGCYRGLMQVCTRWAHCTPDELYNPEINRREGERLLRRSTCDCESSATVSTRR